ncbi:DeoR/GlpR family DNA-binding transcription regulator [Corynebacterium propinquum]
MYAEERRRHIASLAAVDGWVKVGELAERFSVTSETIRRDLAALDEIGAVHRVRGGARAAHNYQTSEVPLADRNRSAAEAKLAIATAALQFVPTQGTVFIGAGTTNNSLADFLGQTERAANLEIVINSLPGALNLAAYGLDNVHLLGGTVRSMTQSIVGPTALRSLALKRAEVAFIGTDALTVEHGLSTADTQEAAIKTAFMTNAHKVVVLCDSSKLGRDYLVSFGTIRDIDVLITDSAAPDSLVTAVREHGVEVVVVER